MLLNIYKHIKHIVREISAFHLNIPLFLANHPAQKSEVEMPSSRIKSLMCLVLYTFMPVMVLAQNSVILTARPMTDSIVLRWVPNSKELWKIANKQGYMVERITIAENKKLLNQIPKTVLTATPLKPEPLPTWEKLANSSKYGAIAAQALYGETFELDNKSNKGKSTARKVYEKDLETEMRYSFALTSADFEPKVAQASALRWVDKTAKKGTQYLYRVYIANQSPEIKVDTGYVYTSVDEYTPLPTPWEFSVAFFDSTAALTWNFKQLQKYFIAYDIERSTDAGKTYQKRNSEPFIPINENPKNKFAFYIDSTTPNVTTQYRIRGISAFGEFSKYTEPIAGMSKPLIQNAPKFVKANVIGNKKVVITWEFDKASIAQVAKFKIYRSKEYETGYTLANKLPIANNMFQFEDVNPLQEGYYKVAAIDKYGKESMSFPVFAQREDNEPPKAPTGIKSNLSKTGALNITWKPNTEKDILGYYIYKSNHRKQEYARITDTHIAKANYTENIAMNALTDSIYYKIIALDTRYNESLPSFVAVKRPDVLPPAPIAYKTMIADSSGMVLVWANSPSTDVAKYTLSRIEYPDETQTLLAQIPHKGDSTKYLDKTTQTGKTYSYEVVAIDDDSLLSEKTRSIQLTKHNKVPSSRTLQAKIQRSEDRKTIILDWTSTAKEVDYWVIYRGSQGERLSQYEALAAQTTHFEDKELETSKLYYYHLKPVFKNGILGTLSQKIEIK